MNVSLLIAEDGADWLERAQAWRRPANEFMVLAQQRGESHGEFRGRVEQRIERLRSRGTWLEQVLLVTGGRRDETALLARGQMLRLLLGEPNGQARIPSVVLDAGIDDDAPATRCLKALAQAVAEQVGAAADRFQILPSRTPMNERTAPSTFRDLQALDSARVLPPARAAYDGPSAIPA
jgi:hypothetical protein